MLATSTSQTLGSQTLVCINVDVQNSFSNLYEHLQPCCLHRTSQGAPMPGASGGPASSIAGRAGPQPSSSGGSCANVGPGAGTMDTWLGSLCSGCLCHQLAHGRYVNLCRLCSRTHSIVFGAGRLVS